MPRKLTRNRKRIQNRKKTRKQKRTRNQKKKHRSSSKRKTRKRKGGDMKSFFNASKKHASRFANKAAIASKKVGTGISSGAKGTWKTAQFLNSATSSELAEARKKKMESARNFASSSWSGAKANAQKVGSNIGAAGSFVKSGAIGLAGQTSEHAQNLAGSVNKHAQNLAGSVNIHAQNLGEKFKSAVTVNPDIARELRERKARRRLQLDQQH